MTYKGFYIQSDRTNLYGKTLRIDINDPGTEGRPYGIPADNPSLGVAGAREELYNIGLRNPWRVDSDPGDRNTGFST